MESESTDFLERAFVLPPSSEITEFKFILPFFYLYDASILNKLNE